MNLLRSISFLSFLFALLLFNSANAQDVAKVIHTLSEHKNSLFALAVSSDGSRALSGGRDGQVILWDTKTWKPIAINKDREGDGMILGMSFSLKERFALVASDPKTVRVLDLPSMRERKLIKFRFRCIRVAGGANHMMAVGGDTDRIHYTSIQQGKVQAVIGGHVKKFQGLCFSPDGKIIYSAGDYRKGEFHLQRCSVDPRGGPITICRLAGLPMRLKCSNDGKEIYAAIGKDAMIINATTGKVEEKWRSSDGSDCMDIHYWPGQKAFVTSYRSGWVRFWRRGDDRPVDEFQATKSATHQAIPVSEDTLLTALQQNKNSLKVWKVKVRPVKVVDSGKKPSTDPDPMPKPMTDPMPPKDPGDKAKVEKKVPKPHRVIELKTSNIKSIAYTADGKYIGIAKNPKGAFVINASTGKQLGSISNGINICEDIITGPTKDYLYLREGHQVRLVQCSNKKVVNTYGTSFGFSGKGRLSPKGNELAFPGQTGNCVEILAANLKSYGHLTPSIAASHPLIANALSVAYSPSGTYVTCARRDGIVFLWKGPFKPTPAANKSLSAFKTLLGKQIVAMKFTKEGLALIDKRGTFFIMDLKTGKVTYQGSVGGQVRKVWFVPKSNLIALVLRDPTKLEFRSFGKERDKELPIVRTLLTNGGLPHSEKSLVFCDIDFSPNGVLAVGVASTGQIGLRAFLAQYRLKDIFPKQ